MGNIRLWDNNDFASHVKKKNSLGLYHAAEQRQICVTERKYQNAAKL